MTARGKRTAAKKTLPEVVAGEPRFGALLNEILAAITDQHVYWIPDLKNPDSLQMRINRATEHGVTKAEEAVVGVLRKHGFGVQDLSNEEAP